VYKKSSAFSASTVSAIEGEGTQVGSSTTNVIPPFLVNGLSINTTYHIAVVVEDGVGAKDAYSPISQATNVNRSIFPIPVPGVGFTTGPSIADDECQNSLPDTGLMTAKALLTDGSARVACTSANCSGGPSENVGWVLAASTTYQNIDANTIGTTTANGIFDFSTTSNLTTAFAPSSSLLYWFSGFSSAGTPNDWIAGSTCSGWTSNSGSDSAAVGSLTATDDSSISNATQFCDQTGTSGAGILCVEQ
jgi:hypothetical protein